MKWHLYWFEKKYQSHILIFFLLLLYIEFYKPLIEKIVVNTIAPYLKVDSNLFGDIIFGVIFFYAIILLSRKVALCFTSCHLQFNDTFWSIILLAMYLFHRFSLIKNSNWYFTDFAKISFLKYSDSVVIIVAYVLFRPSKKVKIQQQNAGLPILIEDDLYKDDSSDILKRDKYSKYIADLVLNQESNSSFAIAIKGRWGSGKSVFLHQIENKVDNEVCIRFNSWMTGNKEEAIRDFFKIVIKKTAPFDSELSKSFENYYSTLSNLDENFSKKIFSSLGVLKRNQDLNLQDQQQKIIDRLAEKKIKLIVFIDDLDRLNSDEILSILMLIRNTFNFPNTFFLVAYDENYIVETIKKEIDKPEEFLEKIFQLEIDLPSAPVRIIESQLIELLSRQKNELQISKIRETVGILSRLQIIQNSIKTIRDAIRFSNSINHIYFKKELETESLDFFLLELLKLKSRKTYQAVRESLIGSTHIDYIKIPSNLSNEGGKINFIRDTENFKGLNSLEISILELIFERKNDFDNLKSLRFIENAIRYFSDDLFGNISYEDFEKYDDFTFNSFKSVIDIQFQNQNLDEIVNKILRINYFASLNSFLNLNKGLLYISNLKKDYSYVNIVSTNFENYFSGESKFSENQKDLNLLIETFFTDDENDSLAESQVLGNILSSKLNKTSNNFLDFEEEFIREMLLNNLQKFTTKHRDHFDYLVFDIYYLNQLSKNDYKVIIDERANSILKKYVLDNPKTYFTTWLLRRKVIGSYDYHVFVLEPFVDQYLGFELFEQLLNSQPSTVSIIRLQAFFRKFKQNNFSDAPYYENVLEIFSDSKTTFMGSISYPNLEMKDSVVRNQESKLAWSKSSTFLEFSEWIAHAQEVTVLEAIQGGFYSFQRNFDLSDLNCKINSAKIYFMVDDYLRMQINNSELSERFQGISIPIEQDIISEINPTLNSVKFEIENASFPKEQINDDPTANPYDFIYTILIELEKNELKEKLAEHSQTQTNPLTGNWNNQWEYDKPQSMGSENAEITTDYKYLINGKPTFKIVDFLWKDNKEYCEFKKVRIDDGTQLLNELKVLENGNFLIGTEKNLKSDHLQSIRYRKLLP